MPRKSTLPTQIVAEPSGEDTLLSLVIDERILYQKIISDEATCIKWLADHGLIANARLCTCGQAMRLYGLNSLCVDSCRWRCNDCKTSKSIRAGSFFEHSHLSFTQMVQFIYKWAVDDPQYRIMYEVGIRSQNTVIDWCNYVRDICALWVDSHILMQGQIGGINPETLISKDVEINSSLFFKRKFNENEVKHHEWLIGAVEKETGKMVMEWVPDTMENTILDFIDRNIASGTRILTEDWKGYEGIANLPGNFIHQLANSSDRTSYNIKGMFSHAKVKYNNMMGSSREVFMAYLKEFFFRKHHKGTNYKIQSLELVRNIFFWISHFYSP